MFYEGSFKFYKNLQQIYNFPWKLQTIEIGQWG